MHNTLSRLSYNNRRQCWASVLSAKNGNLRLKTGKTCSGLMIQDLCWGNRCCSPLNLAFKQHKSMDTTCLVSRAQDGGGSDIMVWECLYNTLMPVNWFMNDMALFFHPSYNSSIQCNIDTMSQIIQRQKCLRPVIRFSGLEDSPVTRSKPSTML